MGNIIQLEVQKVLKYFLQVIRKLQNIDAGIRFQKFDSLHMSYRI